MRLTWLAVLVVGGCAYNSAANRAYQQAELDLQTAEDANLNALRTRRAEMMANATFLLCSARRDTPQDLTPAQREYGDKYCPAFLGPYIERLEVASGQVRTAEIQMAERRRDVAYENALQDAARRRRIGASISAAGYNLQQASRPALKCTPDPLAIIPGTLSCR